MNDRLIDEVLESIWLQKEEHGESTPERIRAHLEEDPETDACLRGMVSAGLVEVRDGKVAFTEAGFGRARRIIRRHRLAERLLHDILEIDHGEMETQACEFEHVLSTGVAESICTLLGHPPACPHGKPIPPGECCRREEKTLRPVVTPLSDLPVGGSGRIVFIRPRDPGTMQRLGSLGILPGISLLVSQTRPSRVIEVGETTVAVDEEIAREIYVKSARSHREDEDAIRGWRGWLRRGGGPGGRRGRRRWDGRD